MAHPVHHVEEELKELAHEAEEGQSARTPLIVLGLHGSNLRLGRSTQGVIETVAGALLIVIAVAEWSGRKVQWHPRRARKRDADRSGRQSLHDRVEPATRHRDL